MVSTRSALFALIAALIAHASPAQAQEWPTKPIRVIVPFGAGSAVDVIPRIVFEQLGQQLGQAIIVENRVGAGGTAGMAVVAKAEPDGYTLLANSSAHSVTPSVYTNLSYDTVRDLAAVIPLGNVPNVLIVSPEKGFKSVADFVATAKAKTGTFNFATTGVGSATHMSAERFRLAAGFEAAHVPFKSGSEALTEIIAGRIEYYFCPIGTAMPFIRDNRVAALVVSPPRRASVLPDVPTTLEAGYADSDYTFWLGLFAPARTPRTIIDKLHAETAKALKAAGVKPKLEANGVEPLELTPTQFDAQVAAEVAANAGLVKALQLKPN